MSNQSLSPADCIELLNVFLQRYNQKYKKVGSMFENTDIKDPLSTNDKMELFYEYMKEYQDLLQEDKKLIDVYGPNDNITSDKHEVYALVTDNDIKYIANSYISLLFIGYKTTNSEKNWNIIKL